MAGRREIYGYEQTPKNAMKINGLMLLGNIKLVKLLNPTTD